MSDFSRHTPWGYAQHYENLGQGIFSVDTASHGGIFVPQCMLHCISQEGRDYARHWSGSEQWYEEDCAWAYVALAFPDRFPVSAVESARKTLEILAKWKAEELTRA